METTVSDGKSKKTIFKYLENSASITDVTNTDRQAFQSMEGINSIQDVIETEEYVDNVLKSRIRNFYDGVYNADMGLVIPRLSRSKTTLFTAGGETSVATTYHKDSYNNVVQQNEEGVPPKSFLYDDIGENIIAQGNAAWDDIAFTSFEEGATGKWIFNASSRTKNSTSLTGEYLYNLTTSNPISIQVKFPKQFMVSYWSKNGAYNVSGSQKVQELKTINGWTLYEHRINTPADSLVIISGVGSIDELKMFPPGVELTTYTYARLVGVTSICSPKSDFEFYKYDNLGRLKLIMDENGNVKKDVSYHFYEPASDTRPFWNPTGKIRCVQTQPGYNTGDQEREERDGNPRSNTYTHTRWTNIGSNTTSCPIGNVNPDWQPTGATRCSSNPYGYIQIEQKDHNPLSPTYNTLSWVSTEYNTTACPIPQYDFTVKNLTDHQIYITVSIQSTNQTIGTYYVVSGTTKVIAAFSPDFYNFYVHDGNSTPPPYKLSINDYVQSATNTLSIDYHSPLTLKVEEQ